jgi:hypothetical protein
MDLQTGEVRLAEVRSANGNETGTTRGGAIATRKQSADQFTESEFGYPKRR